MNKNPFLRYTEQGYTVQLLHCIGRTAVGVAYPGNDQSRKPIYIGRNRNRYVQHPHLSSVFATLRQYRAERRAKDAQLITYEEAQHTLLTPAGCLRLFCLCLHLDCRLPHSRKEIRKAILSQRGPKSGFYLAKLAQIPFNS